MQVDAAVLAEIGLLYLRCKNLEAQLEMAKRSQAPNPPPTSDEAIARGMDPASGQR